MQARCVFEGKKEKTVGMDKMGYVEERKEERPLIQTKPPPSPASSAASGMHAANECGRSSDLWTTDAQRGMWGRKPAVKIAAQM